MAELARTPTPRFGKKTLALIFKNTRISNPFGSGKRQGKKFPEKALPLKPKFEKKNPSFLLSTFLCFKEA